MTGIEVTKSKIVESWRGGRRVQRVELKIDGDQVRRVVKREIVRQARRQGVKLPDLYDNYTSDPWLRTRTLSDDGEGYDDPYVCHAELSFYEDCPK